MTHHSDRERAFTVTMVAAILNVVGISIDLLFWRTRMHVTPPWHIVSIVVGVCMFAFVLARRASATQMAASIAFIITNFVIEIAVWCASTPLALGSLGWVPFQTEKLAVLTVALLAPPSWWVGALSIAIFAGGALAHFATFEPAVQANLLGEPWATLAYGVFALLLYTYRLHALTSARRMADSLAAKRTVEHVSRMLLAIRDFSNTPLQTLYLTTALLRARRGNDSDLLERMDRSLARLSELNGIMSRYESSVVWQDGEESLDAAATLERGFASMRTSSPGRRVSRTRNR